MPSRSDWSSEMATIAPMALELGDRPVRPLTADEALRMVELGILGEDERVELLHGVLWRKAVKSPGHEELKRRLIAWLDTRAETHWIRVESPIAVPDGISLPEPDIVAVEPGDYMHAHPTTALLVIEVAAGSRKLDLTVKAPLYAAAAVPEYWVVDVAAQRVHVFTDPGTDGYASATIVDAGGKIVPIAVEAESIDVGALFAAGR